MCGAANDSHFAAWPCSAIYLWGSKMSEIGSVPFSYQALTFYLQNIERADATARAKRRQTQQPVFARFFWEMSCNIWLGGGIMPIKANLTCSFLALAPNLRSSLFVLLPAFISGFVGSHCEINDDECVHGYCTNNSTCIDLVADYECICPPGFAGELSMSSFS